MRRVPAAAHTVLCVVRVVRRSFVRLRSGVARSGHCWPRRSLPPRAAVELTLDRRAIEQALASASRASTRAPRFHAPYRLPSTAAGRLRRRRHAVPARRPRCRATARARRSGRSASGRRSSCRRPRRADRLLRRADLPSAEHLRRRARLRRRAAARRPARRSGRRRSIACRASGRGSTARRCRSPAPGSLCRRQRPADARRHRDRELRRPQLLDRRRLRCGGVGEGEGAGEGAGGAWGHAVAERSDVRIVQPLRTIRTTRPIRDSLS